MTATIITKDVLINPCHNILLSFPALTNSQRFLISKWHISVNERMNVALSYFWKSKLSDINFHPVACLCFQTFPIYIVFVVLLPALCLPACQSVILLSSLWNCSSFTTYGVPSTEYVRMGDDSRLSLWLKCYRQRHSMKRNTSPEGEGPLISHQFTVAFCRLQPIRKY